MKKDSLGDRMKGYEAVSNIKLVRRMPAILRFDGCAFHTFTKGFNRPFDKILMKTMQETMLELCKNIQGCVFGYTQSDEITLVLIDYQDIKTSSWFDNKVEKMCSVGASMASRYFNLFFIKNVEEAIKLGAIEDNKVKIYTNKFNKADFDCRAFNVPVDDVCNCLIWRQKDAERNSIQMLAQSLYSHKELQGISCNELQNKMFVEKGINWNELEVPCKRGSACKRKVGTDDSLRSKWVIDLEMPILQGDRWYIEDLIYFEEGSR